MQILSVFKLISELLLTLSDLLDQDAQFTCFFNIVEFHIWHTLREMFVKIYLSHKISDFVIKALSLLFKLIKKVNILFEFFF